MAENNKKNECLNLKLNTLSQRVIIIDKEDKCA
jgi:hypothetical protein